MTGPLTGVKVIDLTSMVSGPLATLMLADQGAEVIKVENPDGGDFARHVATRRGGSSSSFVNNKRNKRSVVLNLKKICRTDGIQTLAGRRGCCHSELPSRRGCAHRYR